MGQEEVALLPAQAGVAFSWEHEQVVLKPVSAPAVGAPDMPDSPTKAPAPAVKPRVVPEGASKALAPTRRLSVPRPPGRPSSRGVSRAVRPEEDPFLAAYLACTKSTGGRGDGEKKRTTGAAREPKGHGQRRYAWAGLGLGRLSCKRGNGAVVQSMTRMAKLPELHPRDA
jgi:hypothetical protein